VPFILRISRPRQIREYLNGRPNLLNLAYGITGTSASKNVKIKGAKIISWHEASKLRAAKIKGIAQQFKKTLELLFRGHGTYTAGTANSTPLLSGSEKRLFSVPLIMT